MLWLSLLSLALPDYSAFISSPPPGSPSQASAFLRQFITLDLRTVCLRIARVILPALFAFRPEVISQVPETASALPPSGPPRPKLSVFIRFIQPGKCLGGGNSQADSHPGLGKS